MSDSPADFDEFLRTWTEERIIALVTEGVDPGHREMMLKRRADELWDLATKRGYRGELSKLAKRHGDLRGYLSSLYRAAKQRDGLDPAD